MVSGVLVQFVRGTVGNQTQNNQRLFSNSFHKEVFKTLKRYSLLSMVLKKNCCYEEYYQLPWKTASI